MSYEERRVVESDPIDREVIETDTAPSDADIVVERRPIKQTVVSEVPVAARRTSYWGGSGATMMLSFVIAAVFILIAVLVLLHLI